jgi:GNAT superfamily N-acetyltransferase
MELRFAPISGPRDLAALEALLNSAFPVPAGASFYDDFAVWDPRCNLRVARWGAYQGERLVASALGRSAWLSGRTRADRRRIGIVGGVVTSPDFRGQGLATRLVANACEAHRREGCAAAALWGSEHTLYRRIGFRLAGEQARVPLDELLAGRPARAATIHEGWTTGVFHALLRRSGGLALEEADRSWIEAHRNVRWFWAGSLEQPSAYAALGRGIDLGGIVHEWGGEPAALQGLLHDLASKHGAREILAPPRAIRDLGLNLPRDCVEPLCLLLEFEPVPPEALWFWGLDSA